MRYHLFLYYSVVHNSIPPYLFSGYHDDHKNCVPSMVPVNLWLILIGMKQKINLQSKKDKKFVYNRFYIDFTRYGNDLLITKYNNLQCLILGPWCAAVTQMYGAQRAKFAKKVHKPPLRVNFIDFELNGFNASIWVPWSPSDPKKL